MSNGKYAIFASLLVLAISAGISTFATNGVLADTCNRTHSSCANTNLLPRMGCCTVAAVSGIHITSSGMLAKGASGALTSNTGVMIIANPSANANPGGHTQAISGIQEARTLP